MRLDYIKKPVKVQAVQFTGNNYDEICDFVGETLDMQTDSQNNIVGIYMYTLEGRMIADIDDYIIKYVGGGVTLCNPEIFNMIYELASN